jgi:hypothetical protein
MAENELLAQAVAEGMNLKAAGISGPQDAPEVRAPDTQAVLADLKQYASPAGQERAAEALGSANP